MAEPSEPLSVFKLPRGRKFPFRAQSVAERDKLNIEIGAILDDVNDLIIGIARRELSYYCVNTITDVVQECRIHLWQQSLPKYNAWQKPPVKVSTFIHQCAKNFIIQRKRSLQSKTHNISRFDQNIEEQNLVEPSAVLDRKIEALAAAVIKDPHKYLTNAQAEIFKALMANPDVMMKDIATKMNYKRVSSLCTIKRRIFEAIAAIDIEDFEPEPTPPPAPVRSRKKRQAPVDAMKMVQPVTIIHRRAA